MEGHVLTIGFDPEFADQLELVNNQRTHTLLQTKLSELGHPQVQIKFIQAEAPSHALRTASPPDPEDPEAPESTPASAPAPTAEPSPSRATAPIPAEPAKPARPTPPQPIDMDEFKKDPLIQKALEIFKGQIVEVRA